MGAWKQVAKTYILALSFSLFAAGLSASEMKVAKVRYFGFEIQRIAGIPWNQIDDYGCLYEIEEQKFETMLQPDKAKAFEKYDVRAKVVHSRGNYFIDYAGNVSGPSQTFARVDKAVFADALKFLSCKR